uniref:GG16730 n=1 Tax=Drosophila erecta TaxID=7220 RepID=B3P842_DROER
MSGQQHQRAVRQSVSQPPIPIPIPSPSPPTAPAPAPAPAPIPSHTKRQTPLGGPVQHLGLGCGQVRRSHLLPIAAPNQNLCTIMAYTSGQKAGQIAS